MRLIIFIGAAIGTYILFKKSDYLYLLIFLGIISVIFLCAVFYHNSIINKKKKSEIYLEFSKRGISRINNDFKHFEDTGKEFENLNHNFSSDLDIFGENSLFQYLNSTVTNVGRSALKDLILIEKNISEEKILKRQNAIQELSKKNYFRREFYTEGIRLETKEIDIEDFIKWGKNKKIYSIYKPITALVFITITIISFVLCYINILPQSFIILNLIANYAVLKVLCFDMKEQLDLFEKLKKGINGYSRIFELIENEKFESDYLSSLYANMKINNTSCKEEMKKLSDILAWCGNSKYNAYYCIINILFFSDVFLLRKMNLWKEKNFSNIELWIKTLSTIDALNSIANIAFENEEWVFPEIDNNIVVKGKNIGHPLMGKKAVRNNFELNNSIKAALITGSNMSGKSTFLRTIGVNIILAYIGAPVCAEKFSCSIMNIYTCMRTKDNLEENISSFYAEILRIKMLINACKNKEKVFFLLDEIFKGTNSEDRHTGAAVLIKQLINYGGAGIVSTHDFELCDLENDKVIVNYNFREYYEDNKIKFDYKIRHGRSTTRNAVHLMKMAGIEM